MDMIFILGKIRLNGMLKKLQKAEDVDDIFSKQKVTSGKLALNASLLKYNNWFLFQTSLIHLRSKHLDRLTLKMNATFIFFYFFIFTSLNPLGVPG